MKWKQEVEKINSTADLESYIEEYGNLIFSICYKMTKNYFDAEDLAQDTFLSVYKNLDKFDGKNPKAWISRIATNKCLDYLKRAAAKTVPTEDSYFIETKSSLPSPEEQYLDTEIKDKIRVLCNQLNPPYDEISEYYFCEDMTAAQIADKTGRNIKTIQTQIYRAKSMLKKLWKEAG